MTVFRPPVQEVLTLAERYYTAPEIFEQETQRIFHNHWICVGRSEQIPEVGDYFLAEICEQNLIILRDAQGQARAFFNICRHRGTRLCQQAQGHLGESIRCSEHGWRYSLEGQLRSTGRENVPSAENGLFACALGEWEGFLWVNLAPNPVPFLQVFSPLLNQFPPSQLASLRVGEQISQDLQANWKLIFQAYCNRYLHPPSACRSPSLSQGAFLGASERLDRDVLPLPELHHRPIDRAAYYSLFPTLLLSVYPNFAIAVRIYPKSAERTQIICDWLFDRRVDRASSAAAIAAWQRSHRQAWFRCEQMQRTMHVASFVHPSPPTLFDREYLRVLGISTEH